MEQFYYYFIIFLKQGSHALHHFTGGPSKFITFQIKMKQYYNPNCFITVSFFYYAIIFHKRGPDAPHNPAGVPCN